MFCFFLCTFGIALVCGFLTLFVFLYYDSFLISRPKRLIYKERSSLNDNSDFVIEVFMNSVFKSVFIGS